MRLNFKNNYLIVPRNILPELNFAIFSKQQLCYNFCKFCDRPRLTLILKKQQSWPYINLIFFLQNKTSICLTWYSVMSNNVLPYPSKILSRINFAMFEGFCDSIHWIDPSLSTVKHGHVICSLCWLLIHDVEFLNTSLRKCWLYWLIWLLVIRY